jgi:hypothetical protein
MDQMFTILDSKMIWLAKLLLDFAVNHPNMVTTLTFIFKLFLTNGKPNSPSQFGNEMDPTTLSKGKWSSKKSFNI